MIFVLPHVSAISSMVFGLLEPEPPASPTEKLLCFQLVCFRVVCFSSSLTQLPMFFLMKQVLKIEITSKKQFLNKSPGLCVLVALVRAPLPFQMAAHLRLGFIRRLDVGA